MLQNILYPKILTIDLFWTTSIINLRLRPQMVLLSFSYQLSYHPPQSVLLGVWTHKASSPLPAWSWISFLLSLTGVRPESGTDLKTVLETESGEESGTVSETEDNW